VYPHIAVETVRRFLGSPPLVLNTAEYGVDSIQIGKLQVPTDEQGRLLINFRGPQKTFPHYSFSDVLNGLAPAGAFKDKIVLVGATAIGIYDVRVTPFSGTFPGVEIHANIIDNILRNDPIGRPDWVTAVDVIAILLCGIGLSLAISRIRPLFGTLVTIGMIVLYALASEYVFVHAKIWLTSIYPGMTMVFVFFGVTTFRYMTEEKKKREIKEAFSHYVAPSLVNNILLDPTKLVLGGEERRLSVLFSDIRGFTTISEALKPQELVKLMNDYLTPMTDVILANDGTVDKYMGDAIMAFWGAPVWQEDHQVRACRAALAMMDKLKELQVGWEQRGIPRIDIGIGISTGKLTVGNMGSATRFDYTVMGDSVNLGSRLEGLNKEYGTHIIVPKYTSSCASLT
jgi:adenylate cyclase